MSIRKELSCMCYLDYCPPRCCWSHLHSRYLSRWRRWRRCLQSLFFVSVTRRPKRERGRNEIWLLESLELSTCAGFLDCSVRYLFIRSGEQCEKKIAQRHGVDQPLYSLDGCTLGHDVQLGWWAVTGPALKSRTYRNEKNLLCRSLIGQKKESRVDVYPMQSFYLKVLK